MTVGELLTRGSVWVSLTAYTVSVVLQARRSHFFARVGWVVACVAFVLHVVCAFHFVHDWSHAAAWQDTKRQTAEMTGFQTGVGLYLNYLFTVLWVADAVWWVSVGDVRYVARRRVVWFSLHAFFLFMIVNGAVVFAAGPGRWYGVLLVAMIVLTLGCRRRGTAEPDSGMGSSDNPARNRDQSY